MAEDRNPDVMEMVEETLRENPEYSTKDLKLKAEEIDEGIEDLSPRQFNARYPLQVRRRMSAEEAAKADGGADDADAGDGRASGEDARERVFEMIEDALEQNPDVSNDVLQERAAEIDPSISDLSSRSFHARYPLQVKRQRASERKEERASERKEEEEEEKEAATAAAGDDELRAAVRQALLDFARDVAGADDRGEVVDVLTSVDEYVERVMKET